MEPLKNLEEMKSYIEAKFSSEVFEAKATTEDAFGEQVRWTIVWTPKVTGYKVETGSIWAAPNYYTAAVPFKL
jgi:hypothetical protein